MKKLLVLLLTLCFVFGVASVALADSGDVFPFSDVPQNHWAYGAVQQLQKDGIVNGTSPNTFSGNQTLTRYEMAVYVARAVQKLEAEMGSKAAVVPMPQAGMTKEQAIAAQQKYDQALANISKQDRALIQKLSAEFAAELDAMGVKVDSIQGQVNALQAKVSKAPQFSYQAQFSTDFKNIPNKQVAGGSNTTLNRDAEVWIQPQVDGYITDNWRYYGEIRFIAPFFGGHQSFDLTGFSASAATYEIDIRNAYMYGQALGAKWFVGRMEDNLPFANIAGKGGLVTDSRLDGVRVAFDGGAWRGDIFAGADINGFGQNLADPNNTQPWFGNQALMTGVDAAYNFGPGNAYLGYYAGWGQSYPNQSANYQGNVNPFDSLSALMFAEIGADYQIVPKMAQITAFVASGVNPKAVAGQTVAPNFASGQDLSWLARLDIGTYSPAVQGSIGAYGMYAQTGANSVWNNPNYDVSSLSWNSQTKGMNGNAKGYEICLDWAPAVNMDWHLSWSNTSPIDQNLVCNAFANTTAVVDGPLAARNIYKSEFTVFF